ncbi:MAG: ABC transporter substrate-binding protein [Treponemataceae bacterium]|nr:MAG: ABC transporter substrate-binding protein [Treponemataceae bacterium]
MTIRKFLKTVAVASACVLAVSGCAKTGAQLRIGITQFVEHDALDASREGFIDALAAGGYKDGALTADGKKIVIDYQNAQGDQSNCMTIAQTLVNNKADLILAIATPAAQAMASTTSDIPILITAVTDPASARLVKTNELPGTNVSGTSDLTPVKAQIELLQRLLPNAKTVGFLYNSSEENSKFQIEIAKQACQELGLAYRDATVSNSNEIQQVVQSLVGKVDAIYAPTDNLIAAGMPTVSMVASEAKIPIICGEEGMVVNGGLATYGINYYELGRKTGEMALDILKNGKNPAQMPIQYLEVFDLSVNNEVADALGITLPADLS